MEGMDSMDRSRKSSHGASAEEAEVAGHDLDAPQAMPASGHVLQMAQAAHESDAPATASDIAYGDADPYASFGGGGPGEVGSDVGDGDRDVKDTGSTRDGDDRGGESKATSSHDGGFTGFGAEFDPFSYTDPKINHGKMDPKTRRLRAQHVRIFLPVEAIQTGLLGTVGPDWQKQNLDKVTQEAAANPSDAALQQKLVATQKGYAKTERYVKSFIKTVELADKQATINFTFSGAVGHNNRIDAFAKILAHYKAQGYANLQATLQNEPNGPDKGNGFRGRFNTAIKRGDRPAADAAAKEYVDAYQRLDEQLKALQVRENVDVVGGDMVAHNRKPFWEAIVRQGLNNFVDAYSVHIYWGSNEKNSFKNTHGRLEEIKQLGDKYAPGMPLQITEFGRNRMPTQKERAHGPSHLVAVEKGLEAAFQQGLFALWSVNLGFTSLVKWDAFYSGTRVKGDDRGNGGNYEMIEGPGGKYRTDASYDLLRMFTHATEPGWLVEGKNHGVAGAETHFKSADGTEGALIAMSQGGKSISTRGLPKGKLYVMTWNASGKGGLSQHVLEPGDRSVEVPDGGAVAISTKHL
jgi:hypothetical protein